MSKENDRQEYWDKEVNKAKAELASLTKQRGFYDQPNGNYGARVRTHNQNMTVAARAIADRNTLGQRS